MTWRLLCTQISDAGGLVFRNVLKFSGISSLLPAHSVVIDAMLTLTISGWDGGFVIMGKYLAAKWDDVFCTGHNNFTCIGWAYRGHNQVHGHLWHCARCMHELC
jgi:hypothetical protein